MTLSHSKVPLCWHLQLQQALALARLCLEEHCLGGGPKHTTTAHASGQSRALPYYRPFAGHQLHIQCGYSISSTRPHTLPPYLETQSNFATWHLQRSGTQLTHLAARDTAGTCAATAYALTPAIHTADATAEAGQEYQTWQRIAHRAKQDTPCLQAAFRLQAARCAQSCVRSTP
jgi:hypothetical protein